MALLDGTNDTSIVVQFPAGKKRWIHSITAGFGQAAGYSASILDTAMVAVVRGRVEDRTKAWNYTQAPIDPVFTGALFMAVWQIATMQHFEFPGAGLELPEDQVTSVVLPNPFDTVNVPPTFDPFMATLSVYGREDNLKDPFGELR